ncbi:lysylphosphatidylglycerol synthase transmembrane domain-containing protein [Enterococcus sp. LJL98]
MSVLKEKNKNLLKVLAKGCLLVGLLGILGYYLRASFGDIFTELGQTSPWLFLSLIVLGFFYQYLEGKMVKGTIKPFSKTFTTFDGAMAAAYSAFYRVVTFGAGTIFAEINFYHRKKLTISESVGAAILRFILFKVSSLSVALIALVYSFNDLYQLSPKFVWVLIICIFINAGLSGILLSAALSLPLQVGVVTLCHRLIKKEKYRALVDRGNIQINALRRMLHKIMASRRVLFEIYFWSIAKALIWFIIPYVCLVDNHPDLHPLLAVALISFVTVISGVIPTPAGIGSFEFVYLIMFRPLVGTVDAASSLLLYRFTTFLMPFLIGLLYVVATSRLFRQKESE